MIRLPAFRYDGQSSAQQEVELVFGVAGKVLISGDAMQKSFQLTEIKTKPRVGRLRMQFIFPDGSMCEVEDHPELDAVLAMLPKPSWQNMIHKIENRLWAIALMLLLAVTVLFAVIQYGIPAGAKYVAFKIPLEMERQMGRDALSLFDKTICGPTQLQVSRKAQLEASFQQALQQMEPTQIQLHFRDCGKLGANAFALPSGIIVFTDAMVNMAKNDNELIGVLAHEVGHVVNRHIMRHVLQDSVTGLLLVLLTGDIGSASSFAAAIPTMLVQAKFSRDFETESDDYAARFLQGQGISPIHLANLLQRLAAEHGDKESASTGFLSTHPLTAERVRRLNLVKGRDN